MKTVKRVSSTSCCYTVLYGFVGAYDLKTCFLAGINI